jgi:hypothetical protein
MGQTFAEVSFMDTSLTKEPFRLNNCKKIFGLTITDNGFGGSGIKISRFKGQTAIMTGGRGACIINERFMVGGGGYGIANDIFLSSATPDTFRFLKMGYGGLELGYIFTTGKIGYLGGSILIAAGAVFWESLPKSETNDFKIFPVMEPSVHGVLRLTRLIGLNMSVGYHYANGAGSAFIKDQDLCNFAGYIGLLFNAL